MKKNLFVLFCVCILTVAFCLTGCETKNDGTVSDTPSQSDNSQDEVKTSPYQVTEDQWRTIMASAFKNYTCDASSINGRIYMICPEENLYCVEDLGGPTYYYYFHKGDKVDFYFASSFITQKQADEPWEMHAINATGGFEFSSDWIDWLGGIYGLGDFVYSEDKKSYSYSNSSEYLEFYFENGKLIRMHYGDSKGGREYSKFGTTEISLPEVQ
jgi:hypothetical protein